MTLHAVLPIDCKEEIRHSTQQYCLASDDRWNPSNDSHRLLHQMGYTIDKLPDMEDSAQLIHRTAGIPRASHYVISSEATLQGYCNPLLKNYIIRIGTAELSVDGRPFQENAILTEVAETVHHIARACLAERKGSGETSGMLGKISS